MHTRFFLVTLAALSLASSACQTLKPSLSYKSTSLQQVDLEGATLDVVYSLKNPTPASGKLSHVKYALAVEGKQLFSGNPTKGVSVGASKTTDIHLPVRFKFLDVFPAISTMLTKSSANYTAKGEIGVDVPVAGLVKLPFSRSATFALPKAPSFSMKAPTLSDFSVSGAKLNIPLEVKNGNAFALVASGLTGAVSIGGHKIGTTSAVMPASLSANGTHTVNLPVDIDFLKTGSAVMSLLQGGNAQVKLDGAFKSGGASVPVQLNQMLQILK